MTPEELAAKCFEFALLPVEETGPTRRVDWNLADDFTLPMDFRERVIAAIREAVAVERAACAALADERTQFLSCSPDGHGIAEAIRARGQTS